MIIAAVHRTHTLVMYRYLKHFASEASDTLLACGLLGMHWQNADSVDNLQHDSGAFSMRDAFFKVL